jgi:hypothetical protein
MSVICTIRSDAVAGGRVPRLFLQLIRHAREDQPDAFVDQAMCKITAMLGLTPKLLWSGIHEGTRLTYVSFVPPQRASVRLISRASGRWGTDRRYAWWIAFTT